MKKIERKIREFFGKSIGRYLGRDVVKIVKNVPGRVTKVKVFRKPSYVIERELSLHLGEIIIFKEMTEDEKEDAMFEEYDWFYKLAKLNMKKTESRRKKRKRKRLRKKNKILAAIEKRLAEYPQAEA